MNKSEAYARALELGLKRIHRDTEGEYFPGATYGEYVDALSTEKIRKSVISATSVKDEEDVDEDLE
jgi:hypothetical protein